MTRSGVFLLLCAYAAILLMFRADRMLSAEASRHSDLAHAAVRSATAQQSSRFRLWTSR